MFTVCEDMPEISLKYKAGKTEFVCVKSSLEVADFIRPLYNPDTFLLLEETIILFLNHANRIIGWMRHSIGGSSQTVVDPKLIYVTALKSGASSVILSHNHPSGQTRASTQDIDITKKLKNGCETLGLTLLDHIIITANSYTSLADEGYC